MRKLQKNGGAVAAVLDDEDDVAARPGPVPFRRPAVESVRPRREMVDDFTEDADTEAFLRASGRNRRIRRGLIPKTRNGWIIAGVSVGLSLAAVAAGCYTAMRYMTTSDTFRITSSQQMELDGNSHLSRAQMLSVFGEDVDRNIFHVPLQERRAQLEQMPWVEHATVMRLLPNRLRVHVTERVPVAYLRQGGDIGLIDASGVVLDIPPDAPGNSRYTFPVITGIKTADAATSRQQKMQLFAAFLKDLDSDGKNTSSQLSEVDLSDPEDVKALIPYSNQDVMVHFGTQDFLKRFHKFQEHIAEWHTTYPRLSGVDMRYERQVVLQMPAKDSTVVSGPAAVDATVAQNPAPSQKSAPVQLAKASAPVKTPAPVTKVNVPVKAPAPAAKTVAVNTPARPTAPAAHKPSTKAQEKEAATRKRVEAIKAWMAKREKARSAAKATAKAE
ncbi:cell division protein FtsQ/DivIB [Terriglobus sp. TAA 43]|uniref:cell division protein FtsQ/DivIB n=1 Tax=Terriglobus sp. TAA 43 TaxID=278961 RepID=UPI001E647DFD|nr:FtsQ-type POTRA domain-containing protein [Terriglobus sp. TAA 43]